MNTTATIQANPSLSIAIPAHDAQPWIGACLASIAGQMGPHHELIVVDDGSRDATFALAEDVRHANPHLRIRVLRQPNRGIAETRNRLIAEAVGGWLLFIDADDVLLPDSLAALDAVIQRHAPDVIACDFIGWHPENERKSKPTQRSFPADTLSTDRDAILRSFFADRTMYVWANVFRRDVYARQPQPLFPPGRLYEDVAVISRLLADCGTLYRLARPVVRYRQHPTSITKAVSPRWCADFAAAVALVKETFTARPTSDSVRMHIDVAACHFYICIVKNSYQLAWRTGRAARTHATALFKDSLFHPVPEVLSAMERCAVLTRDRRQDAKVARQVRQALGGSAAFAIAKAASRTVKRWQRVAL